MQGTIGYTSIPPAKRHEAILMMSELSVKTSLDFNVHRFTKSVKGQYAKTIGATVMVECHEATLFL